MELEVFEEGKGPVLLTREVPADLLPLVLQQASPLVMLGYDFRGLLLDFSGDGFHAWFSRMWAARPLVLRTRGGFQALELRIAWRHKLHGKWENIKDPGLAPLFFQLAFTPYIATRAIFDAPLEYQTFDIHFYVEYLDSFGLDYKMMDEFINKVKKGEPAELAPRPYKCSLYMIQLVQSLLQSDYTAQGHRRQLHDHISSILTAALEIIGKDESVKLPLSIADKRALYEIRDFLDRVDIDMYPGNDVLLRRVHPFLNTWKLNYGFQRLFGTNPEEYFLLRRFSIAREMIAAGRRIGSVAVEVGYESSTTFIKEFKKRFGMTPGKWTV